MKSNLFEDLLHQELRRLYSAEKQVLKALTAMSRTARHSKVKTVFKDRLQEKAAQILRLDQMASLLGKRLGTSRCMSMEQIIQEGENLVLEPADAASYDASLIAAAHHFVSYEIEEYHLALSLACRLGLTEIEDLLQKNLLEEKAASARLARVAKSLKPGRDVSDDASDDDDRLYMSCPASMLFT